MRGRTSSPGSAAARGPAERMADRTAIAAGSVAGATRSRAADLMERDGSGRRAAPPWPARLLLHRPAGSTILPGPAGAGRSHEPVEQVIWAQNRFFSSVRCLFFGPRSLAYDDHSMIASGAAPWSGRKSLGFDQESTYSTDSHA